MCIYIVICNKKYLYHIYIYISVYIVDFSTCTSYTNGSINIFPLAVLSKPHRLCNGCHDHGLFEKTFARTSPVECPSGSSPGTVEMSFPKQSYHLFIIFLIRLRP